MYSAYVVKIEHLKPHPNADRLQVATIFGEDTCVSLDVKLGDLGLYFPVDGQLSEEFCDANHMCRKKVDGTPDTGYLERESRKVKAIKLRGLKSNGVYCPISSVEYTGVDMESLTPGLPITTLNGHEICCKYIPKHNPHTPRNGGNNKVKIKKENIAPLFAEHKDTEQLAYNLNAFKAGDQIEITLKMHGTSSRVGYLPTLQGYKRSLLDRLLRRKGKPIYKYDYVVGTRRVVLGTLGSSFIEGFYGSNEFRRPHAEVFKDKLWEGESVYGEIVGFTNNGTPIMPSVSNKKTDDKEFILKYGDTTTFSYGCHPEGSKMMYGNDDNGVFALPVKAPQSDLFVYRMTMTTPEGHVIEYSPDFMRYRCEQMGVKTVPVFWKGYIPMDIENVGDWILEKAKEYYDGEDPVGLKHIREGVVVRIVNKPSFAAYKIKNWYFKCIEGIAKEEAEAPDMEEVQEIS